MDAAPQDSPSGRRDNGLPSADWGALVDLDPRLSDALLSSLASAGVPAFVEPAGGISAWTRAPQLPDRPLHRLWVDPARADTARAVVTAEVSDLSALLAEVEPGATAHGFVQAVPRTAAARVLTPPALPARPRRAQEGAREDSPPQAEQERLDAERDSGNSSPGSAEHAAPDGLPGSAAVPASGPAHEPDDPDAAWRQIVAGYDKDVESELPPWPVQEDVDPRRSRLRGPRPDRSDDADRSGGNDRSKGKARSDGPGHPDGAPHRRRRTDPQRDPSAALPDWVEPAALEDDGHYVPPPPPPVPRLAPQKLAAAATLLAGLLLMFAPGLLLQPRTAGVAVFGVLLTLGGAAALVWLMRDAPPSDSGPGDGAVV